MSKDIRENKEVKNEIFKIPDQIFWEKMKLEKELYKRNKAKGKNN